jgi:hypothetical protein
MPNETIIKKILATSPLVEVFVRTIYYANIKYLKSIVPIYRVNPYLNLKKKKIKKVSNEKKILNYVSKKLLKKGDLVILISSYKNLKSTGYSPQQIIDSLKKIIGNKGTLAMSARPDFKIDLENYITKKKDKKTYFYMFLNYHKQIISLFLMSITGVITYLIVSYHINNEIMKPFFEIILKNKKIT